MLEINAKGMGIQNKDQAVKIIIEKIAKGVDPSSYKVNRPPLLYGK